MKRLFYCPVCGKEQYQTNRSGQLYQNEATLSNLRGGYGRPIKHYKCECGNYLAGSMDLSGWEDQESVEYAKDIIRGYSRGGVCYSDDIFDAAKKCYEQNHGKAL